VHVEKKVERTCNVAENTKGGKSRAFAPEKRLTKNRDATLTEPAGLNVTPSKKSLLCLSRGVSTVLDKWSLGGGQLYMMVAKVKLGGTLGGHPFSFDPCTWLR